MVQQQICAELAELISKLDVGSMDRAMEIGAGTGFLTSRLAKLYPDARWFINDLTPYAEEFVGEFIRTTNHSYIWGDAEQVEFPAELNLIASASTVQWFEELEQFIAKAHSALKPDGQLVISTFGMENFKEITTTMGSSLTYHSRAEVERMFERSGFEITHSTDYIKSLLFDSPTDVLRHIKATGVNSIRKTRLTRGALEEFDRAYRNSYSIADGRVTLTYHPLIVSGKKV